MFISEIDPTSDVKRTSNTTTKNTIGLVTLSMTRWIRSTYSERLAIRCWELRESNSKFEWSIAVYQDTKEKFNVDCVLSDVGDGMKAWWMKTQFVANMASQHGKELDSAIQILVPWSNEHTQLFACVSFGCRLGMTIPVNTSSQFFFKYLTFSGCSSYCWMVIRSLHIFRSRVEASFQCYPHAAALLSLHSTLIMRERKNCFYCCPRWFVKRTYGDQNEPASVFNFRGGNSLALTRIYDV